MKIIYKSSKMRKELEDPKKLIRRYGNQQAEEITKRMNELDAAESLADIQKLTHTNLHKLSGNLKDFFAVNIKQPNRIIFKPLTGELNNLSSITEIKIHDINIDYH